MKNSRVYQLLLFALLSTQDSVPFQLNPSPQNPIVPGRHILERTIGNARVSERSVGAMGRGLKLRLQSTSMRSKTSAESSPQLSEDCIEILWDKRLGKGSYGEVYEARVNQGPLQGTRIVAKRAFRNLVIEFTSSLSRTMTGPASFAKSIVQTLTGQEISKRKPVTAEDYLDVEAQVNEIVARVCPHIAAPYLGEVQIQGVKWLIWKYAGSTTLADLFYAAGKNQSLLPFAEALNIEYNDDSMDGIMNVTMEVGQQLLQLSVDLTEAGITHRDLKPMNIMVQNSKLVLIDFGAAAAMGVPGRVGFHASNGPCDIRYSPPEELVEEEYWGVYDVYSIGLIIFRLMCRPMWDGDNFGVFVKGLRDARSSLDGWLVNFLINDKALADQPWMTATRIEDALSKATRWKKSLWAKEGISRDEEYLKLARIACSIEKVDGHLDMCELGDALEVLNSEDSKINWQFVREILARLPRKRLDPRQALLRLTGTDP